MERRQEVPSKKSTAAAKNRHPEATLSRHSDNVDILWLLPRPRLSALHPPPGAYGSTAPRLQQQQQLPPHHKRPRRLENESASPLPPTTASASSMLSQASPQARRDRVSTPLEATAPELAVAPALHDTLIRRLTEDLQRAAFLASVGVTPKKARPRQAPQLQKTATANRESAPRRHRHPLWLRRRPRLPALHLPPSGFGSALPRPHQQQHLPRHRQRPRRLEYGPASPSTPSAASTSTSSPSVQTSSIQFCAVPPRRVRISPQGIPYRQLLLHAHPHHRRAPLRVLQHLQYRSWFSFLYM